MENQDEIFRNLAVGLEKRDLRGVTRIFFSIEDHEGPDSLDRVLVAASVAYPEEMRRYRLGMHHRLYRRVRNRRSSPL